MNKKLVLRRRVKVKNTFRLSIRFVQLVQIVINILITSEAAAISKSSILSGNWDNPNIWSPPGIPAANDDVTIATNHTINLNCFGQVHNLSITYSGKFIESSNFTITINGNFTCNGIADLNDGNINLVNDGSEFNIGPQALFTWCPGDNTSAGASLFTNGIENFNSSSTLIIKRWYDYSVPLGQVTTGNFGNLIINTPGGSNSIVEWNQNNQFETHKVIGTLTIDQGWITLDKSGSISSTAIGNIKLTSINSSFIAHSGTHPTSFTLTTGSIINNGGLFYGLSDGNGNITIHVYGNFTNSGNVKIINNSGTSNVSNGNATVIVDGDFIQSSGDTRFIYNITTTNSGIYNATIRNLNLSGGIFMGQSACHTGGRINTLNILQDLIVNFSNASDKFRGAGITSIGAVINNAGFAMNVGRNMMISGTSQAEFTTSASSGSEMITVYGDVTMQGCTSSINYGTATAIHPAQVIIQGNFIMNGGTCFLSRNSGALLSVVGKNFIMKNGLLIVKGNSGQADFNINGSFTQSDGSVLLHSNITSSTGDVVKIKINGSFNQSGGILNFDDNISGAEHVLSLNGDSCILSGNGIISHVGAGISSSFGAINFEKTGKLFYQNNGNNHIIDQTIQSIDKSCDLIIKNSKIKISSHDDNRYYTLKILKGGRLTIDNSKIISNGFHNYSGVYVDSNATVSISNEDGFYGKPLSAINYGIKYFLANESIIEYDGQKGQVITGISQQSGQPENKYSILRIKMTNPKYVVLLDSSVFIRKRMELVEGRLVLNNHVLTVENGNADAISHIKGFIESDFDNADSKNILCWKNMNSGPHIFPFGRSVSIYLPVVFNISSGIGNDVSISTRRTGEDNLPFPANAGTFISERYFAEQKVIDRWWTISAPGITADITFTYYGDENTITPLLASKSLCALQWTGTTWKRILSSENGVITNSGSIDIHNISFASNFVIASTTTKLPVILKSFEVTKKDNKVELDWETINEYDSAEFSIEKSFDGINFKGIGILPNNITADNSSEYSFLDNELPANISYYRIKITNSDSLQSYSETRIITTTSINETSKQVKINSVSPNPFISNIKVQYNISDKNAMLEIIDSQGRRILNIPVEDSDLENGYTILNLDYLKKGIYFLNIICNGKKDTMKIIKNE